MNHVPSTLVLAAVAVFATGAAHAQTRIFRCGNTYTNDAVEAQRQNCRPVDGANVTVTVVEGTRVARPPAAAASGQRPASAPSNGPRVDANEQRARDSEARQILEGELRKAEVRLAELQKEYNNGEPERQGNERNYQRYLDRVAELKAAITRTEADIAGIRRELQRLTAQR